MLRDTSVWSNNKVVHILVGVYHCTVQYVVGVHLKLGGEAVMLWELLHRSVGNLISTCLFLAYMCELLLATWLLPPTTTCFTLTGPGESSGAEITNNVSVAIFSTSCTLHSKKKEEKSFQLLFLSCGFAMVSLLCFLHYTVGTQLVC